MAYNKGIRGLSACRKTVIMTQITSSRRVIVIDDQPDIHADFRKILTHETPKNDLARLRAAIKGPAAASTPPSDHHDAYDLESALQGEEGFKKIIDARTAGQPFSLAFIDMRMPPGWDGLRTISEIWNQDPDIQIVICTAYSDQPWSAIESLAEKSDRILALKKPFDVIEVKRMASTLTAKWRLARSAVARREELENLLEYTKEIYALEQTKYLARIKELEETIRDLTAQAGDLTSLVRSTGTSLPPSITSTEPEPPRYNLDCGT